MRAAADAVQTIKVFVPTGKAPAAEALSRGRRRDDQSDFVVGFLNNHKHNSKQILARLEERFGNCEGRIRFVKARKPEAGKPAPKEMIEKLASECDAVVTGVAD